MRCFVEIEKKENRYTGSFYQSHAGTGLPLSDMNFEDTAKIRIKGEFYRLGDLLGAYISCRKNALPAAFDERGQLGMGQYLYSQIFGQLGAEKQQRLHASEQVEVRIVSQDERIALLPWSLMANKGIFLSAAGWSVTVSTKKKAADCEFPSSPRMLVLAPQPAGFEKTDAENHLRTLKEKLKDHPGFAAGENLKTARTSDEFCGLLRDFSPHIVYYYGHGIGDINKPKLAFAAGENSLRHDIMAGDFVRYLREAEVPPLIAYINCCRGTPAARLGIGRLLNDFVPAVIVNRTSARTDILQSQALHLWESVLLLNMSPHRAVSGLYAMMGEVPSGTADARCMTPLLYCGYADWQSAAMIPLRMISLRSPSFATTFPSRGLGTREAGRNAQFQTVCEDVREMLKKGSPKTLSYIRCSQKEQKVETFRRQLSMELRERLTDTYLYEVRPEWPSDLHQPCRSFGDMFAEAFDVSRIEDIRSRISSKNRESPFRQTLIYVNHQPVRNLRIITPKAVRIYLEWWNTVFLPMLDTRQFALSGISFIVKKPSEFRKLFLNENAEVI